jgi:hypothetical protein
MLQPPTNIHVAIIEQLMVYTCSYNPTPNLLSVSPLPRITMTS